MVKSIIKYFYFLILSLVFLTTLIIFNYRRKFNIPPKFRTEGNWILNDTIKIYKNGYRTFPLDSIIEDEDDVDSLLRWSITADNLLTIRYRRDNIGGRSVDLVPGRNQIGKALVSFTVIDPGGLSANKICSVFVVEPNFQMYLTDSLNDTLSIKVLDSVSYHKDTIIRRYDPNLLPKLQCNIYTTDTSRLTYSISQNNKIIKFKAKDIPCTTGIYFAVTDPVNHITFPHSTLVFIKRQ